MYKVAHSEPAASVKRKKISLVGNPNSGKTTLFNSLTGLHQKVANFPGVTVDKKTGICTIQSSDTGKPVTFEITDLPGTYSLYPRSPDERIPFEVLCDPHNPHHPDLVILVADGTNLKRSLFLASQVIDLKIPCVLALNMMDLVKKNEIDIQIEVLENHLGIPVIPLDARSGEGVSELKKILLRDIATRETELFDTLDLLSELIPKLRSLLNVKSNYAALQIAHHGDALPNFKLPDNLRIAAQQLIQEHPADYHKLQSFETLERYKVLQNIISSAVRHSDIKAKENATSRIDGLLMHPVWGYVCFLAILFLIFQAIFSWATWPMDMIDQNFAQISAWLQEVLPQGVLNDLLVNGVLAGIGGIIIFIPQIALLFAFIAILEDTGYLARVSFLMDKMMRKFGLNGRSVIPLMSGVACAVPAIMATRTIGNWKERMITIMVTPLMSCSARLPVYTLLISLIIPNTLVWGLFNLQGIVMMSLYLIGFLAALGSAALMKWVIKAREKAYSIMEIPVYRMPRWSNIVYSILEKVKIFLFDAGKIIIAISIILWYLSSRGPGNEYAIREAQIEELEKQGISGEPLYQLGAQRLEASYAGRIGHVLEPYIKPLGFDWKIGIALVTSFAAREVFVGTMSTIYSVGSEENQKLTVREKMKNEKDPDTGLPRYTVAVGWSLMLFYAFAMQCMTTIAVVKRETGSWKWPAIQFVYMAALAWLSSFVVYQLLK